MLIILYIFNSSHLLVELFYYNRVHASPESVPYFHKLYSESGNTVCISLKRETAVVLDKYFANEYKTDTLTIRLC